MEIMDLTNGSDNLYETTVKNALDKRIIIFNQEVNDNLVEDVVMHVLMWNIEDYGLPRNKRRPITIIINSVGGDTFAAMNCVDIIKESTTPVRCVGMGFVASAAYYIFLACHERLAFKNTALLQHDGSVGVANSTAKAKQTMAFFENMENRIKSFVLENSKMDEKFYDAHFDQELYLYADEAKELGIVDKIIGEDITLDQIFCK